MHDLTRAQLWGRFWKLVITAYVSLLIAGYASFDGFMGTEESGMGILVGPMAIFSVGALFVAWQTAGILASKAPAAGYAGTPEAAGSILVTGALVFLPALVIGWWALSERTMWLAIPCLTIPVGLMAYRILDNRGGSADDRSSTLTPGQGVARLFLAAVVAILIGYLVAKQLHAPVNSASLVTSLGLAAHSEKVGEGFGSCFEASAGGWRCDVDDRDGDKTYIYLVTTKPNSSCWSAAILVDQGDSFAPRKLSSCVRHFQRGWSGRF